MSSIAVSCVVFACVFSGVLLGLISPSFAADHALRRCVEAVVSRYSVSRQAALVLGLLIASAKNAYDTQNNKSSRCPPVSSSSTAFSPITDPRRRKPAVCCDAPSPPRSIGFGPRTVPDLRPWLPSKIGPRLKSFFDKIQDLQPQNDVQRSLHAQALQISTDLGKTRFLLFEQARVRVADLGYTGSCLQ